MALLTPIAFLSGEAEVARKALVLEGGQLNWMLLAVLCGSGVVGFLIGQATYMSIHYTSALAHHVSGAVKSCLQTALGIMVWGEAATVSGLGGLGMTLFGSYMFMRSRMEPPKPPPNREAQV